MQTIGERLEEARKKKGISIREAAEATKIRGDYLSKFESNHFDIGLTEIYTRGFLRTYANFLKVPADRLLNDYTALGRGEARPRTPNREVYGRMDISVASAAEASDRAAPPTDEAAAAEPSRSQPRYPRSGNNLPQGPAIDPATVFKYAKWAGIALAALILVLIAKSFFGGNSSKSNVPAKPTGTIQTVNPNERTITLVALETVSVRVTNLVGTDTDGDEIFKGTLSRGQSQTVAWPGPINIWANSGENLAVEFKGKQYPTKFVGSGHVQMK